MTKKCEYARNMPKTKTSFCMPLKNNLHKMHPNLDSVRKYYYQSQSGNELMEHEQLLKLLSATAQGDKQAFASLYQATSGQLFAVSLKMLKRRELAEEALQEAYVRIWHNASDYQLGKGTVLTWMVSIVRYRALDMLRYVKVRKEEELTEQHDVGSEPPTLLIDEENQQLQRCMDELDEQQKQAIHLAYYNGMSHQEVVAHLDSPLGTIKSWIRRGLQSLQRCLAI
jgi:RNA polymerase sigma factor (sigma-70 family)